MITGNVIGGVIKTPDTTIIVDEYGNEFTAVMTGEEVELTATTNDIRLGKTAALTKGIKTGEKDIPIYHAYQGYKKILAGSPIHVRLYTDDCDYTKFQAIVCSFNDTIINSVAATMVSINDNVYEVESTESISQVAVNLTDQSIDLSIINNSDNAVIVRYFTLKESY